MRDINTSSRTLARSAALVFAAGLLLASPALAKTAPSSLVARYIESVEVAPAVEHRLVIVHPIVGRIVPPVRDETVRLGGMASPDLLAIGKMQPSAKSRAEVVNFAPEPAVLLVGDVLRTETADFAVVKDTVVPPEKPFQVPVYRISREAPAEPGTAESRMLGETLPSAFRFALFSDPRGPELRDTIERWAIEVNLVSERRSAAELAIADRIATRVGDYRKKFATLPQPVAGTEREIVGCAVIVDGTFASLETFGTGKLFTSAWPRLVEGFAVAAAVQEAREDLLAEDLADPADPDRFLADLKKRLLDVIAARMTDSEVKEEGRELEITLDGLLGRGLVLGEDRMTHFVIVADPNHRSSKGPSEDPDLNVARRKARPTEEEKRLLERRGDGGGPVPPAPPPDPPKPPPAPTPK